MLSMSQLLPRVEPRCGAEMPVGLAVSGGGAWVTPRSDGARKGTPVDNCLCQPRVGGRKRVGCVVGMYPPHDAEKYDTEAM